MQLLWKWWQNKTCDFRKSLQMRTNCWPSEDSDFLVYDAVSLDKFFLTFQRDVVPSSFRIKRYHESLTWHRMRFTAWWKGWSGRWLKVESSWNAMAHGDALEGNWKGNWRMECIASTLHTTSEHGVSSITTADTHTSAASSQLNNVPTDLNGLVHYAERQNLVSAHVPSSHFRCSLPKRLTPHHQFLPHNSFIKSSWYFIDQ